MSNPTFASSDSTDFFPGQPRLGICVFIWLLNLFASGRSVGMQATIMETFSSILTPTLSNMSLFKYEEPLQGQDSSGNYFIYDAGQLLQSQRCPTCVVPARRTCIVILRMKTACHYRSRNRQRAAARPTLDLLFTFSVGISICRLT